MKETRSAKALAVIHEEHNFTVGVLDIPAVVVFVGLAETNNGQVLAVNDYFSARLGYTKNEVIFEQFDKLIPPKLRKKYKEHFDAFTANPIERSVGHLYHLGPEDEMIKTEVAIMHADGTTIPAEVGLKICESGECVAAIISLSQAPKLQWKKSSHGLLAFGLLCLGVVFDYLRHTNPAFDSLPSGDSLSKVAQVYIAGLFGAEVMKRKIGPSDTQK